MLPLSPPEWDSKTQNGRFPCKSAVLSNKVCYMFLCLKTVSDKVVRYSLTYISVKNWLVKSQVVTVGSKLLIKIKI